MKRYPKHTYISLINEFCNTLALGCRQHLSFEKYDNELQAIIILYLVISELCRKVTAVLDVVLTDRVQMQGEESQLHLRRRAGVDQSERR